MKSIVCNECCQKLPDCFCSTGVISEKKIGLVKGCVFFYDSTRCKQERVDEMYVCKRHYNTKDTKSLEILKTTKT